MQVGRSPSREQTAAVVWQRHGALELSDHKRAQRLALPGHAALRPEPRRRRRTRRRGDHQPVLVRRLGQRDPVLRRDAGVRRDRPGHAEPRPGSGRGGDNAEDEGDPAGAHLRRARWRCRFIRS